jgi:hypothetical protein
MFRTRLHHCPISHIFVKRLCICDYGRRIRFSFSLLAERLTLMIYDLHLLAIRITHILSSLNGRQRESDEE